MFTEQENELFASISKEKLSSFPRLLANNYKDCFFDSLVKKAVCDDTDLSIDERYWALKVLMKYNQLNEANLYYVCCNIDILKRFVKEENPDSNTIHTCLRNVVASNSSKSLKFLLKCDVDLDDDRVALLINHSIYYSSWDCVRILLKTFEIDLGKYRLTLNGYIPLDVLKLLIKYGIDLQSHVKDLTERAGDNVELLQFLEDQGVVLDFDKIMQYACAINRHSSIVFAFKRGATITKKDIACIHLNYSKETLIFLAKNGVERELFTIEQLVRLDHLDSMFRIWQR